MLSATSMRTIPTPVGDARVHVDISNASSRPRATLVLGHGAGGGVEAADLVALAEALPGAGIAVVRVEQPWRVAGRRVATPPASLDLAWVAVLTAMALPGPVLVGGRSAGARVACRTAGVVGAVGAVALAFPLHPPGRPDRSRLAELEGCAVPTVVIQGDRDAFGAPSEFPAGADVRRVPFADHSFRVPATAPVTREDTLALVCALVHDWSAGLLT